MLHIATFSFENLFTLPKAMCLTTDAAGREALKDHALANSIVTKDIYLEEDKLKH